MDEEKKDLSLTEDQAQQMPAETKAEEEVQSAEEAVPAAEAQQEETAAEETIAEETAEEAKEMETTEPTAEPAAEETPVQTAAPAKSGTNIVGIVVGLLVFIGVLALCWKMVGPVGEVHADKGIAYAKDNNLYIYDLENDAYVAAEGISAGGQYNQYYSAWGTTFNEDGSGSIYFNAINEEKDIGNATIENVKLYSWISAGNSNAGTLNTRNITIDFTDNNYAGFYQEPYGYGWSPVVKGPKNGIVYNDSITIYVDSEIDLNGQVFTSNLQPYTTVVLTEDMAVDEMVNVTGDYVVFDLNGHTITASEAFTGTYDNDKHLVQVIDAENVELVNGTIKTTDANKHALNIYGSEGISLKNMTLDHTNAFKGAPLVINGSSVKVCEKLNLVAGDASWYGMNVDKEGTLAFAPNSSVSMEGEKPLLVVEDGEVKDSENAGIIVGEDGIGRKEIFAESISLNAASKSLTVGETFTLKATVSPENTDNKTVVFTSSDASVATVDANGVVKALKAGKATITATCGDVSAVCEITVTAPTEMPDTNDSNMAVAGVCAALVLAAAACAFACRKRA